MICKCACKSALVCHEAHFHQDSHLIEARVPWQKVIVAICESRSANRNVRIEHQAASSVYNHDASLGRTNENHVDLVKLFGGIVLSKSLVGQKEEGIEVVVSTRLNRALFSESAESSRDGGLEISCKTDAKILKPMDVALKLGCEDNNIGLVTCECVPNFLLPFSSARKAFTISANMPLVVVLWLDQMLQSATVQLGRRAGVIVMPGVHS